MWSPAGTASLNQAIQIGTWHGFTNSRTTLGLPRAIELSPADDLNAIVPGVTPSQWYVAIAETVRALSKVSELGTDGFFGTKNLASDRVRREHFLEALQEIGDRGGEGAMQCYLGSASYRLGEVDRDLNHYQQQQKIAQDIGDRCGEGNSLWDQTHLS